MHWLFTLYISLGLFGILVLVLDVLFSLGEASDADGSDEGAMFDHGVDMDSGVDSDGDDGDGNGDADGDDQESAFHYRGTRDSADRTGRVVLKLLAVLRNFVYFSAGFGGMGFVAMMGSKSDVESLFWSVPFGLIVLVAVRLLRRIQRSTLDSQVDPSQFLMEEAEVIVKIEKGQMGKVRIRLGSGINDCYARSVDSEEIIEVGEVVRVSQVFDDYVLIEK